MANAAMQLEQLARMLESVHAPLIGVKHVGKATKGCSKLKQALASFSKLSSKLHLQRHNGDFEAEGTVLGSSRAIGELRLITHGWLKASSPHPFGNGARVGTS